MSHINPEQFASFYTTSKLGFDIKLVEYGYRSYKPYFKGEHCLELGPATGYMTRLLVNDFESITAVEGSLTLLEQMPDFPNVVKVHSLFEDFKPTTGYDTIIMNHVLEHIEEPEALLKQIKAWLNPGGVLILGVPNAKSFHRMAAVKMGMLTSEYQLNERDKELGHYRVYDFTQLRSHVNAAGYSIMAEGGIFLKFVSNAQIEQFLSDSILDAYYLLGNDFKENCAEIFIVAN